MGRQSGHVHRPERAGIFLRLRRIFLGKRRSASDSASSAFRSAGRLSPGSLAPDQLPFEEPPR